MSPLGTALSRRDGLVLALHRAISLRSTRKFDDEPGAPAFGVGHPDPSVVEPDVFGHQRQSEADAVTPPPIARFSRPAVEALEDSLPFLRGNAGSVVLHLDPEAAVVDDDEP